MTFFKLYRDKKTNNFTIILLNALYKSNDFH